MEFTKKHFDPATTEGAFVHEDGGVRCGAGQSPGDVYVYSPKVVLAVNVALAIKRPLLISGEPGCGKTTLAVNIARVLGRRFLKETITSHTRAEDLLSRFDTLRRLNDAQTPKISLSDRQYYVEPGTIWWAFDPASAAQRGSRLTLEPGARAADPALNAGATGAASRNRDAVALIDEIDKADPDVPNDLLEPFDIGEFTVRDTGDRIVRVEDVLLILTTNGERELPPAFLRRCVVLKLDPPTEVSLVQIAHDRFPKVTPSIFGDLAREVIRWRAVADRASVRPPGVAEYLDALKACLDIGVAPGSEAWNAIALVTLWKTDAPPPAGSA